MTVLPDALTTKDNLKTALGITATDQDTLVEQCIDRATQWIEGQTERKLKARNYNGYNVSGGVDFEHKTTATGDTVPSEDYLYFSGQDAITDECGRGVFHLPHFPVLKVSGSTRSLIYHPNAVTFTLQALAQRGSAVSGYETWDTRTEYDEYVVDQANGVIRLLGGAFAHGVRNYRVKCTAGFIGPAANAQPYVPADLQQCCVEVAKAIFNGDEDVLSESTGTVARSYSVTLRQQRRFIHETVARYRRYSIA